MIDHLGGRNDSEGSVLSLFLQVRTAVALAQEPKFIWHNIKSIEFVPYGFELNPNNCEDIREKMSQRFQPQLPAVLEVQLGKTSESPFEHWVLNGQLVCKGPEFEGPERRRRTLVEEE